MPSPTPRDQDQAGLVLYAMIAMMLPLVVMVGAMVSTMNKRSAGLVREIVDEKALMAVESGLDEAVYKASLGLLVSGTSFTRDLGDGMTFTVTPLNLRTDGVDNDLDTVTDEADEDVFQLLIVGTYAGVQRRIAGYLGPLPGLPPIEAAVVSTNPLMDFKVKQDPNPALVSGIDKNMNGTPGPGPNLPGASIMAPGTTADLLANLTLFGGGDLIGNSPSPSMAVGTAIDLPSLVLQLRSAANITLTADSYDGANFGNGIGGIANIVFRDGDLELGAGTQGAGILVVTGELEFEENARWDGLVICMGGECEFEEGAVVYGAVLLGAGVDKFEVEGEDGLSALVQYSSEALALAATLVPSGKYVTFNGWQELSRN